MKKQAVAIGVVLLIVIIAALAVKTQPLKLVRSAPSSRATDVSPFSEALTFEFNQPLAQPVQPSGEGEGEAVNFVQLDPDVPGVITVEGKKLVYRLDGFLLPNQTYTASVVNPRSIGGGKMASIKLGFTTVYKPLSEVPSTTPRNRLIKNLPYTSDRFTLDYVLATDTFTVDVFAEPTETSKQAAISYIQSQGVDPSKQRIVFSALPPISGKSGP